MTLNGRWLAAAAVAGLAVAAGCNGSSSNGGGNAAIKALLVSTADTNDGTELFNALGGNATPGRVTGTADQGIAIDTIKNRLYHAEFDATNGTINVYGVNNAADLASITETALTATTGRLRQITAAGRRPRGISIDEQRDILYVAEEGPVSAGAASGNGRIDVYSPASTTTTVTRSFIFGAAGNSSAFGYTFVRPWDVFIDQTGNRLFIALSGSNAAPSWLVVPSASALVTQTADVDILPIARQYQVANAVSTTANLHGIVFDGDRNRVIVTDVSAATGTAVDGAVYIFNGAATILPPTSSLSTQIVTASATVTGTASAKFRNPVDIDVDFSNGEIYVVEKVAAVPDGIYAFTSASLPTSGTTTATPRAVYEPTVPAEAATIGQRRK